MYTPHITKRDLFIESNHLVTYKEGMFPPIHLDEERNEAGEVHAVTNWTKVSLKEMPEHHH